METIRRHIEWLPVVAIVAILGGSLPYKFSGAPITEHIFEVVGTFLGLEFFKSAGGYIIGLAELAACLLVLFPRTRALGGLLTAGIMTGAIMFHLFSPLGITVTWVEGGMEQQDGTLFYLACLTFMAGLWLTVRRRADLRVPSRKSPE